MPRNQLLMVSCLILVALTITTNTKSQSLSQSPGINQSSVQHPVSLQVAVPAPASVVGRTNLYCAGYIKYQRFTNSPEIVGAQGEPEQHTFAEVTLFILIGVRSRE